MTRRGCILMGLGGLFVFAMLTACRQPASKASALPVAGSGEAALHAVQSDQLKGLMNQLRVMDLERLPQELEGSGRRRSHLEEVSTVAAAMADAARRIPNLLPGLSLSDHEGAVFRTLAERLTTQSVELGALAGKGDERGVRVSMREINTTCVACHALFRDSPER